MSSRNRVIWREGLFIKPQHFQQQLRHSDYTLHARLSALSDYFYGLQTLAINEDYLNFGRIALVNASGVMPDGTVFTIPSDDVLPPPLEMTDVALANHKVYLALPLAVSGVSESRTAGAGGCQLLAGASPLFSINAPMAGWCSIQTLCHAA